MNVAERKALETVETRLIAVRDKVAQIAEIRMIDSKNMQDALWELAELSVEIQRIRCRAL